MDITEHTHSNDEVESVLVYKKLLESWNNNDADAFAALFSPDGNSIGFDGSQMNGSNEINSQISQIFKNHKVASFVGIVKEVRALSPDVFLLRAVAGMVPPGQSTINPATNAVQTVIVNKKNDKFSIALFQNTPAAFHGRPELAEQLTKELQQAASGPG